MVAKLVTLDSSVIVAALRKKEVQHTVCRNLLEAVFQGNYLAVEPNTVLVEIAAAIRRRTGSKELSEKVVRDLQSIDSFYFLDLDVARTNLAVAIAQEYSVRGMDAVVAQISKEFKTILVSLDAEMLNNLRAFIECLMPEQV
jgi:predicted nucleic acid-binding protein